ncbi:putative toll-like receptor, P-loop containing nucleoside triphosphate hydrolase [Rosa chinensis]|uniref:Putative toll-like receptor, P-loop containing nucleoside triphosphate hydrolase n=1 Tax=Rosa chinensis TaxID=74649 RepID=A0A2P6QMR3_ROSCH|nr:putative toll-like receptor, P-loop containing nucleoside triphosphate hydrolase [Rosa chinensis]
MDSQEVTTKVRLVKCPKCRLLLPELPDSQVYECGGCGAILQAKNRLRNEKRSEGLTIESAPVNQLLDHFSRDSEMVSSDVAWFSRKADASLPSSAELSSAAGRWKYDVYLSFRGVDTRRGFTSHLYDRLQRSGIKTFMDDQDLQVGDDVSPTLLKAIEGSRFAIVVLSQNYASSAWCLDELTKICQFMEDGPRILPVFYEVGPSHVRKQKGSFEDALAKHERSGRYESKKVQQWRDALRKVADFAGFDTQNYRTDIDLLEHIVEIVCSKVQSVLEIEIVQPIEINTGGFELFEPTRKAMDDVMEALKDDEVTAVGVYGMAGVGKTAMVKHVGAHARKSGIFHHVIIGDVSQSPDLETIQGTLAGQLGYKLHEKTEIGRAARLSEEIKRRGKILIILDDIWERMDLSDIGIPSYKELQKCNSKVLLTTRRENVCYEMRCQAIIHLNILSEQDSWALGGKELVEWKRAARALEKSQSANPEHEGEAFRCIKLSYDYLKDEDTKSCFLLCCLFPEDYDIPIGDLFKYAIGKGLFRDAETIQEARASADSAVRYLKHFSLLLDSEKKGCVRMQDVIRDAALNIAKSEDGHGFLVKAGCGLKSWPHQLHEGYSAISLMNNDIHKLPGELVCPKLQILLLQQNADLNEMPGTFFQSPNELRVLDLSLTSITELPQSFSLLMNLQALYLDFCQRLIDFSLIGKLKKLEILSMRGNVLKELSREIGNLINLRMLDITDGIISKIPSKVISQLHRLEELYMPFRFGNWVRKVEGEGEETDIGFGEVTGLTCLNILKVSLPAKCIPEELEFYPNWLFFDICISGDTSSRDITRDISNQGFQHSHKDSRSLSLDTRISALPAWFVHEVTVKTEKLLYVNCKWLNNILVEYHHGRLHMLKHLSIIGPSESLEELMNAITWVPVKPVFENLEELHLECVTSLKELCVGKLPPGSLYNLKLLKVHYCPNLGNILLPSKLLHRLPNLENIICRDMSRLEHVFGCQGFEPEQSKLREMTFINLPAIRNICNGPGPSAMFQALKSLFICHCNFLGCLFSFDTAQVLFQLEDFFVDSCPLLERLIEVRTERVNNKKIILPKLKNLGLEKLPILYSGGATIDIECPSLEHLYVKECPQFTASASDFQSKNQVQVNDKLHYFGLLGRRTEGQHIEAIAESVFSTLRPIETEFTMPMGDFQAFEATRQAMNKVMKALEADEVTAIGVYGMGGVGKSTMVEHVCAEVRDNGMFHQVISAVVSQNPDLRKIQGTLADMLGFILEEETEIGRARRLMQRIRRGNRILVILDNIWERTDLSNIGIPSYYELQRCNSKVLLITRTQNVCHAMECQSNISLDVLSEEDSWTLFVNKARTSFESTSLCDVAKKVARVCAGLPVALIAVAKALGDKCLDDWKEAARRLEASQPASLEDGKVVFNCIKLSYDYLISDDARSCFLLCCLFPEDYDIQIEELLKYGMGKGLFQDSCTMQDARVTAHLVVKYLKDCSLLLETEQDGCVKMHDVIRDVAIRISLSEDGPLFFVQAGCQLKEWPSISAHEGYSAISLIMNKICKLPEELVCPKLLILFLQSNVWLNEIPEYFFQSPNVLRVLDLSRTRISFLPTSFNILINLQTLYLDGCLSTIDNISILGKLKKLEILSMRELPLVELPKEIGDLSHLRMLDITGDYVDNVPSEVICNLNLLEELYMQCNFADWGSKVEGAGEENIVAFDELTGLSCLNVLKVFISDAKCLPKHVEVEPNWVNFDICISRDPSIRKVSLVSSSSPAFTRALTLDTTINALPGWFINAVTMKAEKLQYIMCWGLDNILVEYDCGRLHALKYLSVIGPNENLKMLMNTVTRFWNEPVFQNLEELHLVQVDCLKELCVGELPPGSLCNLRLLKVKHCYELVDALLPSRLLQRLQNLEELICEEIDELEYVFGCEGLEPEQMILTQLIEMRLENLGKLIKIWNGPAHCAIFQNLQSLVVSRCFELENLFTADVAQCLLHLEDLSVELCPMLDNIIEASKDTVDNKIVFPELKNLTLIKLPQLTRFCSSTGSAIECPLLEYLYVERCPQFSTSDFHSRNKVEPKHPQHLDIVLRRARAEKRRKIKFTEVVQEDSK